MTPREKMIAGVGYAIGRRDGYAAGCASDFSVVALEGLASRLLDACGVPVRRAFELHALALADVARERPELDPLQRRAAAAERVIRGVIGWLERELAKDPDSGSLVRTEAA